MYSKVKTYVYPFFICLLRPLKSIPLALKLPLGLELRPLGKIYNSKATGLPLQGPNQNGSEYRMLESEGRAALSTPYFACEKMNPEVGGFAQATREPKVRLVLE